METLYMICAAAGGTVLVCQFLLTLLGVGGHHDVGGHEVADGGDHDFHGGDHHGGHGPHHENASSWFVSLLTFRTLVAAVTFFGLAGLAGTEGWGEESKPLTLLVALAAGASAMFVVAWLMQLLYRLKAEGTVRMDRAIGKSGTVYLPIPAQKAGMGKVMLTLQNRTVECQAVTSHQQLPTGAHVVVVAVLSPDTVEVAPAPLSGE
jgi:hypothetical protein